MSGDIRPGEVQLAVDPGTATDASVAFIGHIASPWSPQDYPKSVSAARTRGGGGTVHLDPAYQPGLWGLADGQSVILLYWMDRSRRDLILQAPRHTDGPRGVFALRSPVRPNPIAMATVQITRLSESGFEIDAIDCFDGTPLIDIKPWVPGIDLPHDRR